MSTKEKLQSYIPEIIANGSVQMDIYTRDAEVLDQMSADRLDVFDQMFVEYGTWGLTFWETFLGIDTNESLSYEKRRNYIKERLMAGNFTFTKERLIQVLRFFGYLITKIEELSDKYMIQIHVSNTITSVADIKALSNYLRVLFPAHLNCHLLTYDETAASTVNANGVGPLTAAPYHSDDVWGSPVYLLESTPQDNVIKADAMGMADFFLASNYPDYVFSNRASAAARTNSVSVDVPTNNYGRLFLTARKANPPTTTIGKRQLVKSNIDRTMTYTDADTQKTDVVRYYIGNRADSLKVNSIEITKQITAPLKRWNFYENHTNPTWVDSDADLINKFHPRDPFPEADYLAYLQKNMVLKLESVDNPSNPDDARYYWRKKDGAPDFEGGKFPVVTHEQEMATSVCETWYQYFDSTDTAIGDKVQYTKLDIENSEYNDGVSQHRYMATQKIVLSDFPANAVYVEVTHIIKRPDATPTAVQSRYYEDMSEPWSELDYDDTEAGSTMWLSPSVDWPEYNDPHNIFGGNHILDKQQARPATLIYPEGFAAVAKAITDDEYAQYHIFYRYYPAFQFRQDLMDFHNPSETNYWDNYSKEELNDDYINAYSHQESHVVTTAVVKTAADSLDNTILTPQTVTDNSDVYLADIAPNAETVTFTELHELLGIPKVIQNIYDEKLNGLENIKLVVGNLGQGKELIPPGSETLDEYLTIIVGYGNLAHANGIIPGANTNEIAIYRFDILREGGLHFINKTVIPFEPILEPGYKELAIDDPEVPVYNYSNMDDYMPGYTPSLVRRYTAWVPYDAVYSDFVINGKYTGTDLFGDPGYVVTMSRKKKFYIYRYYLLGEYGGYLASCVRPASEAFDFIKCPEIKITNTLTMETKSVTNPSALEACRTCAPLNLSEYYPRTNNEIKISESNLYGLPLAFIKVRTPFVPKPALDGSGPDSDYEMPSLISSTHSPIINGLKFKMIVVDQETNFATTISYEYTYGNGASDASYDIANDKMPTSPSDIMPDLTLWMDTAYDYSKPGYPALLDIPTPPAFYTYYPSSQFASFYYPYVEIPESNIEPFSPSILTGGVGYTAYGDVYTRKMPNDNLYSYHDRRGTIFVAYDNSELKRNVTGSMEGTEPETCGVKYAVISKTAFSTYKLFGPIEGDLG